MTYIATLLPKHYSVIQPKIKRLFFPTGLIVVLTLNNVMVKRTTVAIGQNQLARDKKENHRKHVINYLL